MHDNEASTWVAVAQATDLASESARVVRAAELELALIRTPEGFFALDNACPHTGGPLGEGLVQGRTVTCPLHGWQFDLRNGACLNEPGNDIRIYPVEVKEGKVYLKKEGLTG